MTLLSQKKNNFYFLYNIHSYKIYLQITFMFLNMSEPVHKAKSKHTPYLVLFPQVYLDNNKHKLNSFMKKPGSRFRKKKNLKLN